MELPNFHPYQEKEQKVALVQTKLFSPLSLGHTIFCLRDCRLPNLGLEYVSNFCLKISNGVTVPIKWPLGHMFEPSAAKTWHHFTKSLSIDVWHVDRYKVKNGWKRWMTCSESAGMPCVHLLYLALDSEFKLFYTFYYPH